MIRVVILEAQTIPVCITLTSCLFVVNMECPVVGLSPFTVHWRMTVTVSDVNHQADYIGL